MTNQLGLNAFFELVDRVTDEMRPCRTCSDEWNLTGALRGGEGMGGVVRTIRRQDGGCTACGTQTSPEEQNLLLRQRELTMRAVAQDLFGGER